MKGEGVGYSEQYILDHKQEQQVLKTISLFSTKDYFSISNGTKPPKVNTPSICAFTLPLVFNNKKNPSKYSSDMSSIRNLSSVGLKV